MKQNQKVPASAILFYVISVILLLVFAFQVYYAYDTVSASGLEFSSEWKTILPFFFAQTVMPFIGAVVTYGIGAILAKLSIFEVESTTTTKETSVEDEAMEDFVSSLKNAKTETKTKKAEDTVKTEDTEKVEKKAKPTAKKAPAKKATKAVKAETVEEVKTEPVEEVKEETTDKVEA